MKSLRDEILLRKVKGADLISSEVGHRRFHPSSLGFHPAKQDFIKFVGFVRIASSLQAFFVIAIKNKSFTLYPFRSIYGVSFNL